MSRSNYYVYSHIVFRTHVRNQIHKRAISGQAYSLSRRFFLGLGSMQPKSASSNFIVSEDFLARMKFFKECKTFFVTRTTFFRRIGKERFFKKFRSFQKSSFCAIGCISQNFLQTLKLNRAGKVIRKPFWSWLSCWSGLGGW